MFNLFKHNEHSGRGVLKSDFEATVRHLEAADSSVRVAVGHAINLANSMFRSSYSIESFQAIPMAERVAYIHKLNEMQVKLRDEAQDPVSSVGFGLFAMWIAAVAANDNQLTRDIAAHLAKYSEAGDLSALENAL